MTVPGLPSTPEQVRAGQAVYSRAGLAIYDWLVLGLSNSWIWRCPTRRLLTHYDAHVSANHLDVGVGTGFFLDHCQFPSPPRLELLDLNANSLAVTARRVRRYQPGCWQRNVLEPWDLQPPRFTSIGLNYLLHCLPGNMAAKSVVFDHLQPSLEPGGVVFGSTLLQGDAPRSATARRLMAFYNQKGIFSNTDDDRAGLERELARRFTASEVVMVGCAALFWGRRGSAPAANVSASP